jgi:hypothetical protein
LQPLLADLLSLCISYWEYELSLESALEYTPLYVMAIVVVVANCPFVGLLQNLKWKWGRLAH